MAAVELMDRAAALSGEQGGNASVFQGTTGNCCGPAGRNPGAKSAQAERPGRRNYRIHRRHTNRVPVSVQRPARKNSPNCGRSARGCSHRSVRRWATGATVIIEDVAVPVPQLAAMTLDLQRLFDRHGYTGSIIFGQCALEGNLHFVITPTFPSLPKLNAMAQFADDMCGMIVHQYGGSLKAEHGTGRNIAPFVELGGANRLTN